MLFCLPTEVLLEIVLQLDPGDIATLQAASKHSFRFIQYHERYICRLVAKIQGCEPNPFSEIIEGKSRIQVFRREWLRMHTNESLISSMTTITHSARQGLNLLWAYHDAFQCDAADPDSLKCRSLVKRTTVQDLDVLIRTAQTYSDLLVRAFQSAPNVNDHVWTVQLRASRGINSKLEAFADVLFVKGMHFVAQVLLKDSPEAMRELAKWSQSMRKSVISGLWEEQRWKIKIAKLQPKLEAGE